MKLSIVTVNFNHKYFPKLAVEALEKSKTDFDFEIIFVDNGSSDPMSLGFLEQAAKDHRIKFFRSHQNLGFAGGNNLGARHATGEYFFILNPDTTVQEDTLQMLVDYIQEHPEIGILAPKLVYADGHVQESCRRDMGFWDLVIKRTFLSKTRWGRRRLQNYLMGDFHHDTTQEVELVTGAAMLIPRKIYEEVSGFDERYFLFMEDFDLCKEVRKAGYKVVYFPKALVNHFHKRLSGGNFLNLLFRKVFWLHLQSAAQYFWKWR